MANAGVFYFNMSEQSVCICSRDCGELEEELTRRKKTIELTRSIKNLEWIRSKLQIEIFVWRRKALKFKESR